MALKFHHLAIACKDIDKTAKIYEALGYVKGTTVWDKKQKVRLCMLESAGMPSIELVSNNMESSPVSNIVSKNGVIPYHTCYSTNNIEKSIEELCRKGFMLTVKPIEAILFSGRKIAFMYHRDSGLIELVEE
tara:strand:+ start:7002 stop:7397 length:396 start_codon:yes stop_codon:yes gene_type:complete